MASTWRCAILTRASSIIGDQADSREFSTRCRSTELKSDYIRRALGYAREHLDRPLPIEAHGAEAASLSLRQLGRAFRRKHG